MTCLYAREIGKLVWQSYALQMLLESASKLCIVVLATSIITPKIFYCLLHLLSDESLNIAQMLCTKEINMRISCPTIHIA